MGQNIAARRPSFRRVALSGVALGILTAGLPAAAATQAAPSGSAGALLEEVVITARKKSQAETAQSAPLAVTAYSGEQLEAAHVRDVQDLSFAMPNVSLDAVGTTPGVQNFAMRGLGINSSIPSVDPTVGLFVDEVYLGVTYGVVLDLFDLEGIEVLRGPQGLLFGRNVTGGAVLVRTREPQFEPSADFKVAAETGLNLTLAGAAEGPLNDRVAGRIVAYYKRDVGYFDNSAIPGSNYGADRTFFVRPSVKVRITDSLETLLRAEHGRSNGDGGVNQNTSLFTGHHTGVDTEGFTRIRWDQITNRTTWDVGSGQIVNVFGWRDMSHRGLTDIDGTPQALFNAGIKTDQTQWSDELRYSGKIGERIDVTAGVYYFDQEISYRERRILRGGVIDSTLGGDQKQWTAAAFAAGDVRLSDAFTLNLGLRYTREHKRVGVATFSAVTSPCNFVTTVCAFDFRDAETWENLIPKIGFQWRPQTDVQVYGFWTKGVRSGGYNFRNVNRLVAAGPTDPEVQNAFELGFKGRFLERRLRLNGAAFINKIDDMQREFNLSDPVAGVAQVIRNSADATIQGFEADAAFLVTPRLALTGSVGYLDGRYTRVRADINNDGRVDARDKALDLPRLAPWTYNLGVTYDMPLGAADTLVWQAQYSHRDRAAFTDANTTFLSEADLFDASLTYKAAGDRLSVSVFGRNLTNEVYEGNVTVTPFGVIRFLEKGRRYGVELNVRY